MLALWKRWTKKPSPVMASEDAEIIREFARGRNDLREQALEIHRRYIPVLGVRGTPEQRFMAEIDNPAPDLALRSVYRMEVIGQ